jgi:uncharacterized RDD family membrane protein YckC
MNDNSGPRDTGIIGHLQLQTPEAVDFRLEIAGIGARAHAFVVDWHIRLLLALAWLLGVGFSLYSLEQMRTLFRHELPSLAVLLWLAPAAAIYFLYHPLLETVMAGRTPGKRMAGIRLVTVRGGTPGIGALLLRNLFRLLDSLPGFYLVGLAAVALTKQQVRIGDLAAGLVLVYDNAPERKALRRATGLALHSRLSIGDQSLLLDLLERWQEMEDAVRVRFAEQFLQNIGRPLPPPGKKSGYSRRLKAELEQLLAGS